MEGFIAGLLHASQMHYIPMHPPPQPPRPCFPPRCIKDTLPSPLALNVGTGYKLCAAELSITNVKPIDIGLLYRDGVRIVS